MKPFLGPSHRLIYLENGNGDQAIAKPNLGLPRSCICLPNRCLVFTHSQFHAASCSKGAVADSQRTDTLVKYEQERGGSCNHHLNNR